MEANSGNSIFYTDIKNFFLVTGDKDYVEKK